ncbi:MAG: hypothetical protein VX725_04845, partial [Actinomycetota bacterium]|nr:hypothetical protein [Actinomycetota bacterium]
MDTDDTIEASNLEDEDNKASPLPKKKIRRSYAIITLGIVLLIIAPVVLICCAPASWVSDDSYILSPGNANNTAQSSVVVGTETFLPVGVIADTTVAIQRSVSLWA